MLVDNVNVLEKSWVSEQYPNRYKTYKTIPGTIPQKSSPSHERLSAFVFLLSQREP